MNKNNTINRIKEEDNRALGKFLIIIILAALFGGVMSALALNLRKNAAEIIQNNLTGFLYRSSPYAILAVTAVIVLIDNVLYQKCLGIYRSWDGENEEDMNRIEAYLGYALWLSSINVISTYFFFGTGVITGKYFDDPYRMYPYIHFLLLIGAMILSMIIYIFEQKKLVNFEKELNPEKKGSIFDMRFAKKWEASCDEAQKLTIYKAAYKAYQATNMACIILWVLCILISIIWNIGIMPLAVIAILWFVQTTAYCMETNRLNKNPSGLGH